MNNKGVSSSTVLIIIAVLAIIFAIISIPKQETYPNGIPTYFLEPDGYVIVDIDCGENHSILGGIFLMHRYYYGYILESDYEKYLNNTLEGTLIILSPYTKGRAVSIDSSTIVSVQTGVYKDLRKQED